MHPDNRHHWATWFSFYKLLVGLESVQSLVPSPPCLLLTRPHEALKLREGDLFSRPAHTVPICLRCSKYFLRAAEVVICLEESTPKTRAQMRRNELSNPKSPAQTYLQTHILNQPSLCPGPGTNCCNAGSGSHTCLRSWRPFSTVYSDGCVSSLGTCLGDPHSRFGELRQRTNLHSWLMPLPSPVPRQVLTVLIFTIQVSWPLGARLHRAPYLLVYFFVQYGYLAYLPVCSEARNGWDGSI